MTKDQKPTLATAEPANDKSKLTLAASKVSGTLFCVYHRSQANADTGAFLMRGGKKVWMCERCLKIRNITK